MLVEGGGGRHRLDIACTWREGEHIDRTSNVPGEGGEDID